MEQLNKEHEQLHHSIMRTERDQQFEVERLRREYTTKINAMQERQGLIVRELHSKRQELERMELRIRQQGAPQAATSYINDDKARRLGRIR